MAYLTTAFFVQRVFNPLAKRFGIGGAETLVVPGRRTGHPTTTPLIPVEHGGARYLISTRSESEWVRNLRAAGGGELGRGGAAKHFLATEIPAAERPQIIAAYRQKAGKTTETYFKKLPDAADHPIFRLESTSA